MFRSSYYSHFYVCVFLFSAAFFSVAPSAYGQQQDIQPLLDRLERLERDIRTLNIQLSRGGPVTPLASTDTGSSDQTQDGPAIARLGARMDSLENDLRVVTGTVETTNYQIVRVTDRLDKLVSDIEFRLTSLENRGGQALAGQGVERPNMPAVSAAPAPAGVQTIAPAPGMQTLGTVPVSELEKLQQKDAASNAVAPSALAPSGPLPAGTAKEQYTYAFNLLRQTNYAQAEVAFKAFIGTHGADPLASNARYWLGETYYVRRAYNEAAQMFLEAFSKDAEGPKASDSLLKLGKSLGALGKTEDACTAFNKLLTDFPKASSSVKNAVAREREQHSCP